MTAEQLTLPYGAVTRSDVGQLIREASAVENFLSQAQIRQPGTSLQLPKQSRLLDEIVSNNGLNLLQPNDRQKLSQYLSEIYNKAPVLHISFNNEPSPIFQQKLVTWIRQQMHPTVLLQIGLHPSIGAGCALRTNNKYFDFSLRRRFADKRSFLIDELTGRTSQSSTQTHIQPSQVVSPPSFPVTTAETEKLVNISVESK